MVGSTARPANATFASVDVAAPRATVSAAFGTVSTIEYGSGNAQGVATPASAVCSATSIVTIDGGLSIAEKFSSTSDCCGSAAR
ncbi:hypothetical protein [Nannocystis exedens]|uniref:hypothetical protein n=1 Tax=Nannocystis exedens TaxID=54 RepID=UPI000BBA0743